MARLSHSSQPRYSTGRRRKRSTSRRTGPVGPTPARRKGPAPALIIAGVIVALIFCWIFGRGCGGNQEARENELLREYTSSVNKLITRSAAVGTQFENLRAGVEDLSRDDVSRKLEQMLEAGKEIAQDSSRVEVPQKAEGLQPTLQLSLDLRLSGMDQYRAAILDVLDKKGVDDSVAMMSQGLLDLVVSDHALQRFRTNLEAKLKQAKVSFEKVADSVYLPRTELALTAAVREYVGGLTGDETGSELHGVAVVGLSTSPASVDRTSSGVSILPYSATFTVKVTVENQGNQTEDDVPVAVTLTNDADGSPQKKTQKITRMKAGETATLVFEDVKPVTGSNSVNVLTVLAGPVPNEKNLENNEMEMRFIMRAETGFRRGQTPFLALASCRAG